jgi:hypothetical protein
MRNWYGEVILKKGSVLYHTSDNLFEYNFSKPMLFCTFHPSEWDVNNEYVTFIKLKKKISLLFMIQDCKKAKIFSSLDLFTNHPNLNLAKKNPDQLFCYIRELKKENFNGWFSSIENKVSVEVSLINDPLFYKVIKTEKLRRNWSNGNSNGEEKRMKIWGDKYPICTIKKSVILNLNERYKNILDNYKKYEKDSEYLREYIFQILLDNAIINYHKSDFEEIKWNC